MGKSKRKNVPGLQDLLDRPICYYCNKDFEDLSYLCDHQKAKHFKCDKCGRRLTTIGGLSVHMSQVHKEKLERVANAEEGRDKPDVEIFGMEGYPPKLLEEHKQRVTDAYFKREAEHRAKTGNPPPGSHTTGAANPQKQETLEETKKRLAEFKAKRAAEKAAAANGGSGSGTNTPPIKNEEAGSLSQAAMPYNMPGNNPSIPNPGMPGFPPGPTFNGPPLPSYQQPIPPSYDSMPPMSNSPTYPPSAMPGQQMYPPSHMSPPFQPPPIMSARGPNAGRAGLGYSPPNLPIPHKAWPSGPSPVPAGGPNGFGFQQPPTSHSPTPPSAAARQNSLPSAPGLPQRPASNVPNISKEDMARMHGAPGVAPTQAPYYNGAQQPTAPYGAPGLPPGPHPVNSNGAATYYNNQQMPSVSYLGMHGQAIGQSHPQQPTQSGFKDSVDETISRLTGEAPPPVYESIKTEPDPVEASVSNIKASEPQTNRVSTKSGESTSTKSSKKQAKDAVKLLWSDTVVSPEEKRARKIISRRTMPGKLPASMRTQTTMDQAGDLPEVTGAVDEAIEQD